MMKTYSNRRRSRTFFYVASAIAVLVLLLILFFARTAFESVFWRIFSPLYAAREHLSGPSDTEAELAYAQALAADRDLLAQENEQLKNMLGRTTAHSRIVAAVLQRPPESPYDTFVIDAGEAQGIVLGSMVSAGGGTLIGTVTQVYATASRVTLFSAPGESHQALLVGESENTPITVSGKGGATFVAEVPAGVEARVGQSVVFPGLGVSFVGSVEYNEFTEGESFRYLYIRMPVALYTLRFVEVLSPTP